MTVDASAEPTALQTFDERLGEAIHQVLWRRKIRQTEFARAALGITQSAFSRKLRGERPFFAGELALIAAALDLAVTDLMPSVAIGPDDGDDDGGAGAPTRARTWDLRIISSMIGDESPEIAEDLGRAA